LADTSQIEKENMLSQIQLYSILTRAMLGGFLLGIYRIVIGKAGRDAWISIILGGLLALLSSLVSIFLCRRFPGYTFVEYAQFIVGKWMGRFLGMLLIIYFIFLAGIFLRFMGELVVSWILPETPLLIILTLSLTVIPYMVRKGILVLGRYCTIITVASMSILIIMLFPASDWMISNILPLGQEGVRGILSGIPSSVFGFAGYESILMIYSYAQDTNKTVKTVTIALAYAIFAYTLATFCLLLFFGPKTLQFVTFPPMVYLETVEIPLIERLDMFTFFIALFAISASIGVMYSMASLGGGLLFKLGERKKAALFVFPLVLLIAWLPENVAVLADIYTLIGAASMAVGLGIPLLLLILSLLMKKEGGIKLDRTE
jgi:spore germination protein